MLTFDVNRLFTARGIKQGYKYLRNLGMSHNVASRFTNGDVRSINLRHVMQLCEHLRCTPNDLLNFNPTGTMIDDKHPLHELVKQEVGVNLMDSINNLPLDKLRELQKHVNALNKE